MLIFNIFYHVSNLEVFLKCIHLPSIFHLICDSSLSPYTPPFQWDSLRPTFTVFVEGVGIFSTFLVMVIQKHVNVIFILSLLRLFVMHFSTNGDYVIVGRSDVQSVRLATRTPASLYVHYSLCIPSPVPYTHGYYKVSFPVGNTTDCEHHVGLFSVQWLTGLPMRNRLMKVL